MSTAMIEKMLLESNRKNHENSKFIDAMTEHAVRGGRWIGRQDIPKESKVCYPVFDKDDNILLYPISHSLTIGSTGTGCSS